jgi:hypothetical protein
MDMNNSLNVGLHSAGLSSNLMTSHIHTCYRSAALQFNLLSALSISRAALQYNFDDYQVYEFH